MNKTEFQNLKKNDIVTHSEYVGYYIVKGTHYDMNTDTNLICCQDIDAIGIKTEFGYIYETWDAECCTKITNPTMLEAIKFACDDKSVEVRSEFVCGVEWLLNRKKSDYEQNTKEI